MSYDFSECSREGCDGPLTLKTVSHCSAICLAVDNELQRLEAVIERCSSPKAKAELTEQWAALVTAADALSDYTKPTAKRRRRRLLRSRVTAT